MHKFSRRSFSAALSTACVSLPALSGPVGTLFAAEEVANLNRFPRMMQNFLIEHVRAAHHQSVSAKAALETRQDAERYVQTVREKIARSFGPFPEKTDLNPRITGGVQRDTYRIENIIFDSRPNFPVTANLYLPLTDRKVPGVIGTCGHSTNGKAAEAYQAFAQGLARLGYACLIYDPIGQGERLQYADERLKSHYGPGTREHIHAGNQQYLVGEFFGAWRAWDGIRALDYLLTRPEIDVAHLGVTGNSGGGTMTTWLCGVEPRWTMAAPSCFVTEFRRNAENELPADTEQCPPHALALGLEHEDFLAALAPKPIVILTKERDYFDIRGGEAAYQRLKRLYTLLGYPDNIKLHTGPTEHGYSIENREAMYGWFNRVTGVSTARSEPEIVIEKDETLWCTPSGQVAEFKPETVFTVTRARANELARQRPSLRGTKLAAAIREVLNLPASLPADNPEYRIFRSGGSRDYPRNQATYYAVETEPEVFALCTMLTSESHQSRPPRGGRQALLYIAHRSSDGELRNEAWLRDRISSTSPDLAVFTCDVRGIGESLPNTCGGRDFDSPYGPDYFYAVHGLMLDRSYLGQKTLDVLRVLQWLQAHGYDQVDLIGNGWGGLSATFAAVLAESVMGSRVVQSLSLHDCLESFHSLATDEDYDMPLAYLPNGVLRHFDLPDCHAELQLQQIPMTLV